MAAEDFLTIKETAHTLGVSTRHAHRLADSGSLTKIARGLIDRNSVERYLQSHRLGRTRAWAEHTAWGAIALLAGRDADWLGATQTSRLRHTLRELTDAVDLLSRMRDRAHVHTFAAHPAAIGRLGNHVASADLGRLGVAAAADGSIDGYLAAGDFEAVVRDLGFKEDTSGKVVLRVTTFDFDKVADLVDTSVVAALDAAASTDPRIRGVGQRALEALLEAFR